MSLVSEGREEMGSSKPYDPEELRTKVRKYPDGTLDPEAAVRGEEKPKDTGKVAETVIRCTTSTLPEDAYTYSGTHYDLAFSD